MSLTVLSVAFPFAPVRPGAVGGAEQVLSALDEALVEAGHRSVVVACEGSEVAGRLVAVPVPRDRVLREDERGWCRRQFQAAIDRVVGSERADVIHMHGMDFAEYTLPAKVPGVVTLHMPIAWYRPEVWSRARAAGVQLCCVSETQRRSCSPELGDVAVVPNGVELGRFERRERGDFAVVLGRICPEKNAHEALEAGSLAALRVVLGGQVFAYEEHMRYFRDRVWPLLGSGGHEFLGAVGPTERQDLLSRARCLLHPTRAPETSSLVAMEAMAAGTPVIAYRSGALPEVVEDGVTGFLVNDVREMAEAIGRVDRISGEVCRAVAERRFGRHAMVRAYFDLYGMLCARGRMERRYA